MGWTYESSNVASSALSWIRLRIADTTSGNQLLQDEEIEAFIGSEGNQWAAAILAAETLGGQSAAKSDKTVGKLRIAAGQASERYFDLADRLRNEMGHRAGVYAGGTSVADMQADDADTDRVDPAFSVGQFDNVGSDSTGESDW